MPNASTRQLKVLIDYGSEATALFHPRIFANVDEDTYPAKVRKSFVPADNVIPLLGGERQADVRLRFVGRTDEASKFPKNVDNPVTGYIVPHLGVGTIVGLGPLCGAFRVFQWLVFAPRLACPCVVGGFQ
jgi:hypothetical protein|uniref:Uncharacterized protein n=1 Tax=Eutreptiella gymnastica TaxID=73025 RepID=A0A7S4FWE4_9EUGL